jgi:hypothetical protein
VSLGNGYKLVHDFCADLVLCPRGHTVVWEGEWWNVYGFKEPEHADKFRLRFGGEKFNPTDARLAVYKAAQGRVAANLQSPAQNVFESETEAADVLMERAIAMGSERHM